MTRSGLRPAVLHVVAAMVVLFTSSCGGEHTFAGYERRPTPNVAGVVLPAVEADGSATDFSFRAPANELLLVYFGFTSCPDVCPTTLADVRAALEDLGEDADRVTLAMITIDVEVDTPELLVNYVRSFMPGSVAIRTDDDSILRAAAGQFGADYGSSDVDGTEEVYHTASLYAVDDAGDLVLTWAFGTTSSDMKADLAELLDRVDDR